ncbi:Uncharacterized protein TPAR_04841 [Tolypocladium paradoxum]|uniref:Uncharacterized protein n=1 Tax=Tolypocladium paradoxum TaxID=94208 RepID=A0A2S4KXR1_9HYPO|nr:Uncharacterized protein TPAR_04841 [Tolypocladium paradoxum]
MITLPYDKDGAEQQTPFDNSDNAADPISCPASASPIRIAVRCMSHKIPGEASQRVTTIGNLICQHQWGRNMDQGMDFIRTTGFPHLDGEKADFLLDSGMMPPGTNPEDVPILAYRWSGKTMQKRDVGAHLQNYIRTLPFKEIRITGSTTPGKTTSQLRDEMTETEWNEHMRYMVFQKIKYRRNISREEVLWLTSHLEQFDGIMREHIARRQWHRVPLWESQDLWLNEHRELSKTSDLALMDRILEQHKLEIQSESRKA